MCSYTVQLNWRGPGIGKDFVVVVADAYSNESIIRMHDATDKIMEIGENKALALAGPHGDCKQFGEYVRRNVHLHQIRHGTALSTEATANFTRTELAAALRRNPFFVDAILAGFDNFTGPASLNNKPRLFWIDNLASMVELDKAAHGYGAHLILSILDRYYKPDLNRDEAMAIVLSCLKELEKRFLLGTSRFVLKYIGPNGTEPGIYLDSPRQQQSSLAPEMSVPPPGITTTGMSDD